MTAVDPTAAAELHDAGRLDEAEAAYRQLVADHPADPAHQIALADVLTDAGRPSEAAPLYQAVITAAPDAPTSAGAYDGMAALLQDAGEVDNAIGASPKAAQLRGNADDAYRLGYTLDQMNRPAEAFIAYSFAAQFRPQFAEAHGKVGSFLLRQGKFPEAVAALTHATDADPTIGELFCNLAQAKRLAGDEDGALKAVRKSIDLKPDLAMAHTILGCLLRDRLRPANALVAFKRAVELDPNNAEAFNNWAGVLQQIGRVAEAAPGFERAAALAPAVPTYHENLGKNRLLRGDLAGGWPELDWRRLDRRQPAGRPFPQPLWNGSPLAGQTVLLTAERSAGDVIQCLRYAPLVAGRGAYVIVECPPELGDLALEVDGVQAVVAAGQPLPPFDLHCPLMTLPMVFNSTLESIPATMPYLQPDPAKVAEWAPRLPTAGRRVGLAWSNADDADRMRSLTPARLAPVLAVPGIAWVNLQPGVSSPAGVTDLSADLKSLADAAALISHLDLVITVDSPLAHLAGALGKPTWLMLQAVPDWRWLLARSDSPWYPSARLFRQPAPGEWAPVVAEVAAALAV